MALAIRTATRLQDQDDVNVTPGAGVDGFALTWDNATARFVMAAGAAGSGTAGRVAQWAAGGVTLENANLIGPANVLTLVAGAPYTLTIPATGTAALLGTAQTFTASQVIASSSSLAIASAMSASATRFYVGDSDTGNVSMVYMYARHRNNAGSSARNTWLLSDLTPTANSSADYVGLRADIYSYTAFNYTGAITGLSFGANILSTGSISTLYGIDSRIAAIVGAAGTTALAVGYNFVLTSAAPVVFANVQGVRINSPALTSGSITEFFGIFITNQTSATTNYAIFTGLGLNRFGDQVGIVGGADRQQLLVTGHTTQAVATPVAQVTRNDTAAGVSAMLGLRARGSGANGDGGSIPMQGSSSTTAAQDMARIQYLWNDATHATRKADLVLSAFDTAEREGVRIRGTGAAAAISFLGGGVAPVARQLHIADAAGGANIDAEARAAINAALAVLESFGFVATA